MGVCGGFRGYWSLFYFHPEILNPASVVEDIGSLEHFARHYGLYLKQKKVCNIVFKLSFVAQQRQQSFSADPPQVSHLAGR